jgi:hypothetical protein
MESVAMGPIAVLCPEQPVLHAGRRATFFHMSRGSAIIRYWGDSHAVAVPPESLSLPFSTARSTQLLAASDEPLTRELAARDAAALQRRLSP